jgi:hypothetical protein
MAHGLDTKVASKFWQREHLGISSHVSSTEVGP